MIRLAEVALTEVQMPLKEPFRISSGVQTVRRILLVRVRDHDGAEGWGECAAGELPNYGPETIDTAWAAIGEWVAPRLFGRAFAHPREIFPVLEENFRGHRMAKGAVEMACWDLAARRADEPLARFLSGTREGLREVIDVGISLGIQESPTKLAEKVLACRERGYRKIKVKIGPGEDLAYVAAAHEALGGGASMMADANNAYTEADFDHLEKLDAFGLMMIEQPLAWEDIRRHAALQQRLKTPICLDESITSLERAEDMVALGAGRIVNIKPGRVGGFSASLAIHDFCAQHGVPVWCGGMLESGVGRAHNVALASLPNFKLPGDLSPSERYWERDLVDPEWTMDRQGQVRVPLDRPGIGVDLDLDRIEALTVRSESFGG